MKEWKCIVCGYIHKGEEPPDKCPVCGAEKSKFVLVTSEADAGAASDDQSGAPSAETDVPRSSRDMQSPDALSSPRSPARKFYDQVSGLITKFHLHPISVHVPNGLLPASVLFVILAVLFQFAGLDRAAWYNLIVVFLTMPAVIFTGYADWKNRYGGNLTTVFAVKMICAGIIVVTSFILIMWRLVDCDVATSTSSQKLPFLAVHFIMLAAAGIAGHFGGKLVFKD